MFRGSSLQDNITYSYIDYFIVSLQNKYIKSKVKQRLAIWENRHPFETQHITSRVKMFAIDYKSITSLLVNILLDLALFISPNISIDFLKETGVIIWNITYL